MSLQSFQHFINAWWNAILASYSGNQPTNPALILLIKRASSIERQFCVP